MKYQVKDVTFAHVLCISDVNVFITQHQTKYRFPALPEMTLDRLQLLFFVSISWAVFTTGCSYRRVCRYYFRSGVDPMRPQASASVSVAPPCSCDLTCRGVVAEVNAGVESASAAVRHKPNVLLKVTMIKRFHFVMAFSARKVKPGKKEKSNLKWMLRFILPLRDGLAPFLKVCIQAFCDAGEKFVHTQGCAFVDLPSSFFFLFFCCSRRAQSYFSLNYLPLMTKGF